MGNRNISIRELEIVEVAFVCAFLQRSIYGVRRKQGNQERHSFFKTGEIQRLDFLRSLNYH